MSYTRTNKGDKMSDDLKSAALLEEIARISGEAASRIADLRVQITSLVGQVQNLKDEIERLNASENKSGQPSD